MSASRAGSRILITVLVLLGSPPATWAGTSDSLTVVTLNLWHDQHDWPKRLNVIVAEMRRIRPDVLCLQEVLQNPSLRNQAETLGDSLDCHVQFASVDGPDRPKRYGNAILTPHSILVGESRNLAPADDYRAVAHVRLDWRGRAVDAYSTHLHHTAEGGSIRTTQIRHLLAYVDSTRGDGPLVIAGDFNCELGSPEMDLVTARYDDAFHVVHPKASRAEAMTFNPRFGVDPGVIDHIFVERRGAKPLTPLTCEVIFNSVGPDSVWASDHFGVVAKLGASPRATSVRSSDSQDNLTERIRRVENGLLLPVVIKGQSATPMTLEERMAHYKTPGVSIAVVDEGKIAWARGYGVRVAGGNDPVTPETPFQAGSISKAVTAAAALIIVDHGQLSLDQPVNARLTSWKISENDFTRERAATLRHILTHTSGLTNHAVGTYAAGTELPPLPDILDGKPPATSQPIRIDYLPGSRWRYSGGGFTVLQQLLIDVRAEQFPALMRELVLRPVGMLHSTFQQPIPNPLAANAAAGHTADGTPLDGNWRLFPEMAAAGLWSTPSDLARFLIEIQKATRGEANPILSQQLAEAMVSRQFEDWGLGVAVRGHGSGERFSHGGDTEGYKCDMVGFRRRGCGAVIMTNGERGERLTAEILRSIAREYQWPDFAPKEKSIVALDASVMSAYVGKYKLEINEASVIFSVEDGQFS